jgi:uncharacterized membrane protein
MVEEAPQAEETPKAAPAPKSGTGLEPNVAAFLAYLFGWISGLVFFLIEKDDKFVRFAAAQSIVLNVAGIVFGWVFSIVIGIVAAATFGFGTLLGLLIPVFWIGYLVVWIMLMVKAYQGTEWELPIIGKIARNFVK